MTGRTSTVIQIVILICGLVSIAVLGDRVNRLRPPTDESLVDEDLYVSPTMMKRMSLGFGGVIADWYWMRSLQYVGGKVIKYEDAQNSDVQLDSLSSLNMKLLPQLLDSAATLDPQFSAVYEYGAVILPAVDEQQAIKLLQKGIAANPQEWRLHYHLGFIYWQRNDFVSAAKEFDTGAKLPGAPSWMEAMSARMLAEGGSRDIAREIYARMARESDDESIRQTAEKRLMQVQSFDDRDLIRKVLAVFKQQRGRCIQSWREVAPALSAAGFQLNKETGAPLDPAGTDYVLTDSNCDVDLDFRSKVPYK